MQSLWRSLARLRWPSSCFMQFTVLTPYHRTSPVHLQNFYGFRKIKSDPLRLRDAVDDNESKYWKFRHDKFQRGRPDLLSEIRKSNHTEAAEKKEVDALRSEVYELRSKINSMAKDMERLTSLLQSVVAAAPGLTGEASIAPPANQNKKRKITPLPSPVGSFESATRISPEPMAVTSLPATRPTNAVAEQASPTPSDRTLKSSNLKVVIPTGESPSLTIPPIPSPAKLTSAGASNSTIRDESLSSVDQEMLTSLFALEPSSLLRPADDDDVDDDPILMDVAAPEEYGIYDDSAVAADELSMDVLDQLEEPLAGFPLDP